MADARTLYIARMDSPVGPLVLAAGADEALYLLHFDRGGESWRAGLKRRLGEVAFVEKHDPFGFVTALEDYFAGDIGRIEKIPVVFTGTPFQNKVWKALRRIPAGATESYGGLARRIGEPTAMRAVGLANGQNPVAIVVPCHRVIGADGSLTGYGGGLPNKKWLLAHEAKHAPAGLFAKEVKSA